MEAGSRFLTSTDLKDVTSVKSEDYGTVGATKDGRRYRYVLFGGNVTAGNLVIAPSLVSAHQNIAVAVATPATSTSVQVTLGAAAATADQYAEGLLTIGVDGSGVPIVRKIKGNTAGNASTAITVYLDGREPLLYALTTSNVVSLSPSIFASVTASATAGFPIGIVVASATSGQYGWVQTFGPVGAVNDAAGALSALGRVKQSTTVAGAIVASTAATDVQIGTVVQATAASKAGLIALNLD